MKKNHSVIKRLLSVLLIAAMLVSPVLLSPLNVNAATEEKMPAVPSYWPGGASMASVSDNDTMGSSNYTAISISALEYSEYGELQFTNIQSMTTLYSGSLLKIIKIPGSEGLNPEDYNLTLHLYRPEDGIDITLPTLNYYLPVKQTLTSSDGRLCDIFIIAVPEVRKYHEKYRLLDYRSAGELFVNTYLEMNMLYWDMYYNCDFPASLGNRNPASRRALVALSYGMQPYIVPSSPHSGVFPFGSEMRSEIAAEWLLDCGYFTPRQAEDIFESVYSYYIEYAKKKIESPELLSIEAYGSVGERQEDGSYILYYPSGLDFKKLQNTATYITKDPVSTKINVSGSWKINGVSSVTLFARDPATIHIYGNETDGIIKSTSLIKIIEGDPILYLGDFEAYGRKATINHENHTVSLHIPDECSFEFAPELNYVGSGVRYLDCNGVEIKPDEEGRIDFTHAEKLVVIDDFSEYMQDIFADPVIYTKEYALDITQGNSSECELLTFSFGIEEEEIERNGNNIIVYIPYGTDWNSLSPVYETSYDAVISSINGDDFEHSGTMPIIYRVTAQNGINHRDYLLRVIKKPASDDNYILSFKYGLVSATIDNNDIISLGLPAGSSVLFAPLIEISDYATISPSSGTVQDFSSPVTYTVTAQSGAERKYIVNVITSQAEENPRKAELQYLLNAIIQNYRENANDDWEWMNLGVYEGILQNNNNGFDLGKQIKDLNLSPGAMMTDKDRLIMMLTARGFDCTNLAKYNNGTPFLDAAGNEIDNLVSLLYNCVVPQGSADVNCCIFALIALDTGNYTIPESATCTRDKLLNTLIDHEYFSDPYGIDMVGMLMYAIAPYQGDPIYGDIVRAKLNEGVSIISKRMRSDFCFESWGARNSEAASQVVAALSSCGIDCYTDARFSSVDGSVLSSWVDVFSVGNGFSHISGSGYDGLATYEACYALQWYLGFLENGGAGHPYYLYYHLFDFSFELSSDADMLSFSIDGKEAVITEGGENGNNTITIELPKGMPLTNITPDIVLSDKATLIAPSLPVTFVEGVEQAFTVLAEDGKTAKTYFVTVTTSDILPSGSKLNPDSIVLETGSQREIEILNREVEQTSSGTDILLTVAHGIDTSNLRLIADISYGAVSDPTVDGSIILDLSDWTTFTVVSADGTNTSVYRIKVQQKGKASIESFSLSIQGRVYAGAIDHDALTITISGVDDSSLSSTVFAPDIELGEGTIVCSPLPGIEQDFSVPVVYTVAGNDIESCSYTVRVTNLKGELIKASGGDSGNGGNNYIDYTEITNRLWWLVTENNTIVDHQVSYGRRLIW